MNIQSNWCFFLHIRRIFVIATFMANVHAVERNTFLSEFNRWSIWSVDIVQTSVYHLVGYTQIQVKYFCSILCFFFRLIWLCDHAKAIANGLKFWFTTVQVRTLQRHSHIFVWQFHLENQEQNSSSTLFDTTLCWKLQNIYWKYLLVFGLKQHDKVKYSIKYLKFISPTYFKCTFQEYPIAVIYILFECSIRNIVRIKIYSRCILITLHIR